jgi:hypothetical protein
VPGAVALVYLCSARVALARFADLITTYVSDCCPEGQSSTAAHAPQAAARAGDRRPACLSSSEMSPPLRTGLTQSDAQDDFQRARRAAVLARLTSLILRHRGDVDVILPFDEVVAALGFMGEHELGLRVISLDSIVGSVDRPRGFDRQFRPTSSHERQRWERIAAAMRRGDALPPISAYRIGELHFVRDGHHRVSVSRALGLEQIEAYVTEVLTRVGADRRLRLSDLPVKSHERLFNERVPLDPEPRRRIAPSRGDDYAVLAEGVEAWGFRLAQELRDTPDRREIAALWFEREYAPVVELLREADMIGSGTETDAYLEVARERYRLLMTREWSPEILARLRERGVRGPRHR